MSAKANGLYSNWVMYFPDGTGWWVVTEAGPSAIGFKSEQGWSIDPDKELEGAALVAPLSILFWEKE